MYGINLEWDSDTRFWIDGDGLCVVQREMSFRYAVAW
jgi:hypothetical protein